MAGSPRIVVADDSPFMRTVLGGALSAAGFTVVGNARDGDEALAQCRTMRPDAMTLDLAMPGLDGIGVLRALKESGAPAVPVIVVSAFSPAHGARAVDALAEGAFDLVPKPAVGEPFHSFTENLAARLREAVASGVAEPRNGHAAQRPRRQRPRRRRARGRRAPRWGPAGRRHRGLHGRPARARPPPARAPGPSRRGHPDRAAHAGRLHRLAGGAPGRHVAPARA
jgi:two-component system chemotaxis response regulator CheB